MKKTFLSAVLVMMFGVGASAMTNNSSYQLVNDTVVNDTVVTEDSVILESLALAEDTVTEDSVILESLAYVDQQTAYLPGITANTVMDYKAIEVDALPQAVKDVIARDFLGATVKEAYIEEVPEVSYKVVLVNQAEKVTTVVFDAEGKVKA